MSNSFFRVLSYIVLSGLLAQSGCVFNIDSDARSCRVGDRLYSDGTSGILATDGCNTCSCDDGELSCTLMACVDPRVCGGIGNRTCSEHEYCAYQGECGYAAGTSTCKPRPDACPEIYAPVCGCDGATYDNECAAARHGTGFLHEGPCKGQSCKVDDAEYPDGTGGIPAPDGCNVCQCKSGSLACTKRACPASACVVNGEIYLTGSSGVPDPYSCNSCTCSDAEITACTEIACPLPEPCTLGRAIYQHGRGFVSSDGSTSCTCKDGNMSCTPVP